MGTASKKSRQTAFYKHYGFKGAESHIDDKYGIDIDDIYNVHDILAEDVKQQYGLRIISSPGQQEDKFQIGYVRFEKLLKPENQSNLNQ